MTLAGLALRNMARNRFRVALTALAVAISVVAFLLLRTVIWSLTSAGDAAAKDRLVTRHKVTFVLSLPKRYVEDVRNFPHVTAATFASWFGGKDPQHDREFFSTLAVDAPTFFTVYNEMKLTDGELDTWQHDRQGAIVGEVTAKKLGWKVGDRVALESGIYPGDWHFNIDGIYTATARSVDRSTLVFHWDYMNDALPVQRRDQVGWIVSRVDAPGQLADMSVAFDKRFEELETPTLSQDEGNFNKSFMAMFSTLLDAVDIISGVLLLIMMLILGNTIAMGVRERTGEYGVLRAIGFLPKHIVIWILGESLATGLLGGLLGVAVALPFINLGVGRFIEENMSAQFPYFRLEPRTIALGLAMSALLGVLAAAIPAWRASKLKVVDALRRVA